MTRLEYRTGLPCPLVAVEANAVAEHWQAIVGETLPCESGTYGDSVFLVVELGSERNNGIDSFIESAFDLAVARVLEGSGREKADRFTVTEVGQA